MLDLDTNHVSELFYQSAAGERLCQRLLRHNAEVFTTAITVKESLRAWHHDTRQQIPAYARLLQQLELFAAWLVLPWDNEAADRFDTLRFLRGKIGTAGFEDRRHCARSRRHAVDQESGSL